MRIGYNPYKDQSIDKTGFIHQVIIPVFIPNQEGYFKESLPILKLCLQSLFATMHGKTFVTVVNNGSCAAVTAFLQELFDRQEIHEIVHTANIGKLNAIVKGLAGTRFELVTLSDADVLFLDGWQSETIRIFKDIPKAGVVGIVPQFNLHKVNCANVLLDNLFGGRMKFLPVKNAGALDRFYESIGWDRNFNHDYLKYSLGLQWNDDLCVLIGSGHFVATYKRNIFDDIPSFNPYRMGGYSEDCLDSAPLRKDYWRLTTYDNFAYHIGNAIEPWMLEISHSGPNQNELAQGFPVRGHLSGINFLLRVKAAQYFFKKKPIYRAFLRWAKLPAEMVKTY